MKVIGKTFCLVMCFLLFVLWVVTHEYFLIAAFNLWLLLWVITDKEEEDEEEKTKL